MHIPSGNQLMLRRLMCLNKGLSIYLSIYHTIENASLSLWRGPTLLYQQGAEHINAYVGERGFVRSDSTFRKRSHFLMELWSMDFSTDKTLDDISNHRTGVTDPESLT